MRIFHARRVRTTRSWAGALRAVTKAVRMGRCARADALTSASWPTAAAAATSALRYYEQLGLIPRRPHVGGQRRFPPRRCAGSRSCGLPSRSGCPGRGPGGPGPWLPDRPRPSTATSGHRSPGPGRRGSTRGSRSCARLRDNLDGCVGLRLPVAHEVRDLQPDRTSPPGGAPERATCSATRPPTWSATAPAGPRPRRSPDQRTST